MKKLALASFASLLFVATWLSGCMNREPAAICPVPIQVTGKALQITGYDGVDMIIVIDNSGSMIEEQAILATGFFTMINSLVDPTSEQNVAASANDVRVAVVTSDLGLQAGGKVPQGVPTVAECNDNGSWGDNGEFQSYAAQTPIHVQDNVIDCDPDGSQCPNDDWECVGGKCQSPNADGVAACPSLGGNFAELTPTNNNHNLAFQVACMAQQGTGGCGVEQQLEAAVVGLKRNSSSDIPAQNFIRDNYLLAVLIVSDEEDCSIADAGLFQTPEFKDKVSGLNTSCNFPESNEQKYLYPVARYKEEYAKLKKDANGNPDPNSVVFAAIVGVPKDVPGCQGRGNEIANCLANPDMELEKQEFTDPTNGSIYWHFRPACIRDDDPETPEVETEARPGRRYVKVAQDFGDKGYIYSICNKDWGPAMKEIANLIASQLGGTCYDTPLDWDPENRVARCDVVAIYNNKEQNQDCKEEIVADWLEANPDKTESDYKQLVQRTLKYAKNDDGTDKLDANGQKIIESEEVACPLAKIPADLSCADAEKSLGDNIDSFIGWYYCEDNRENFDKACRDGIDNDGDNKIDTDDSDCNSCAAGSSDCDTKSCSIKVQLTDAAQDVTKGISISVQCLQQFSFEDENCQENTPESCTNGKDDDGNGVWDCNDNLTDPDAGPMHRADPNCCPMTVKGDGTCEVDTAPCNIESNNWPDACRQNASKKGCILP